MEYRLDLNNLYKILELVSDYNCKLLPVIKGRNEKDILQLYNEGFREFGENRLNELSNIIDVIASFPPSDCAAK